MALRGTEQDAKVVDDTTPEDVAAVYQWANLTGAKYRDYSAERREQRAGIRYRAAKQQVEQDLRLRAKDVSDGSGERTHGVHLRGPGATAALRAIEEEREIAEAHESAQRKQRAFEEAERLRRDRTGDFPGRWASHGKQTAMDAPGEHANDLISQVQIPLTVQVAVEEALAAVRPAWLERAAEPAEPEDSPGASSPWTQKVLPGVRRSSSTGETLLDSREQVALRWPALQALAQELRRSMTGGRLSRRRGPAVAIVSPAGGAGGTSLAASLANALARDGERVLLVQTTPQSLLPLYFGVGRLEWGEVRPVGAREGRTGTVSITALDTAAFGARTATESAIETQRKHMQEAAIEGLLSKAQDCNRVVIDLAAEAEWLVRGLAGLRPMVLASVAPEMRSVAGLPALEQRFGTILDNEGGALAPFYVLNRFDAGLPLHLDIREVLRRELDERLLPVAVRSSESVGEALAQGATVMDYASGSPVARDYAEVALWLETVAPASPLTIEDTVRGRR